MEKVHILYKSFSLGCCLQPDNNKNNTISIYSRTWQSATSTGGITRQQARGHFCPSSKPQCPLNGRWRDFSIFAMLQKLFCFYPFLILGRRGKPQTIVKRQVMPVQTPTTRQIIWGGDFRKILGTHRHKQIEQRKSWRYLLGNFVAVFLEVHYGVTNFGVDGRRLV